MVSKKQPRKSESSKFRVKLLLSGVLERIHSPKSRGSSSSFRGTKKEVHHDLSQTSALTESSSRLLDDDSMRGYVVDIQFVEQRYDGVSHSETERQHVSAALIQSVFRGYRQRYEYQMMVLRQKLQQIEANKQRQLTKLAQRTKVRKRHEKSAFDFHHDKTSRQLQRIARIVPHLFRETQTKLRDNAKIATTAPHVLDLQQSHISLQIVAHAYLECLEQVPGIWDAIEVQWMGPKKPRPRRGFGPDGKIIARRNSVKRYNTHDDDLPVSATSIPRSRSRKESDRAQRKATFEKLCRQAKAAEASTSNERGKAMRRVQALGEGVMLN